MTVVNTAHLYGRIAQIIPQRLYFASFQVPPQNDQYTLYFPVADYVHYDAFYDDFGPLNLAVLYRFCEALHELMHSNEKRKVVVFTDDCDENRVNAAYLVASYMIIYHHFSAERAHALVHEAEPPEYTGFRDAAMGPPSYLLSVKPVIQSVEKALKLKWFDFATFDADEYEHYERVENGDFNWIIPDKILSFCGPHNRSYIENGYPFHAPEVYFDYFRQHGISTIVRLNKKLYDAKRFTEAGFDHKDLFFIDGSTPSDDIVLQFIDIVDTARGGVAIHCKAGLGRTGTLIACWMMKEFRLTAAQCMGWLRICRPGSVIGPQQQFLIAKQQWCWSLKDGPGQRSPLAKRRSRSPPKLLNNAKVIVTKLADELDDFALGDLKATSNGRSPKYSLRSHENGNNNTVFPAINDETAINEFGQSQGDRLLEVKAKAQHSHPPPVPRKPPPPPLPRFSSATTPIKQLKLTHRPRPAASTVSNGAPSSTVCRNLNLAKIPITKVTVSTCHRPAAKNGAKKIRIQPYPPTVGLDLKTSTTLYDLRPRQKLQLPPRYDFARTLKPNASAFMPTSSISVKPPSTRL